MKKQVNVSLPFMVMGVLFCVCLIAANLFESKQISLGPLEITAGLIVFPISYIINDCLVEVWGFSKTRIVIWLGFAMNFFFVSMGALADWLPGAPYWTGEGGFHTVFGVAPRITVASFLAFLVGSFINAYVMDYMKTHTKEGKGFSARAILSTVAGETADSILFFPLALGGVVPWDALWQIMLWQVFLKTGYEVIALPITIQVVNYAKRFADSTDVEFIPE